LYFAAGEIYEINKVSENLFTSYVLLRKTQSSAPVYALGHLLSKGGFCSAYHKMACPSKISLDRLRGGWYYVFNSTVFLSLEGWRSA
jgi:hypothetical protein